MNIDKETFDLSFGSFYQPSPAWDVYASRIYSYKYPRYKKRKTKGKSWGKVKRDYVFKNCYMSTNQDDFDKGIVEFKFTGDMK